MNQSRTNTLKVLGATLHYEACGTGPVLLLIPSGPTASGVFAPIRSVLSDRYTVVTYDPPGLSRSPFDASLRTRRSRTSPTTGIGCSRHSAPSRRTCSAAAAAPWSDSTWCPGTPSKYERRSPTSRRSLDCSTTPTSTPSSHERFTIAIAPKGSAMGKFLASAGLEQGAPQPPEDPTPEMTEAMARMQSNLDFFLGHMWLPLGDYAPDISGLRSLPITVAVGEASKGQLAYRAVVLAERLGKNPPSSPVTTAGSVATQELSPGASTRCSAPTERDSRIGGPSRSFLGSRFTCK